MPRVEINALSPDFELNDFQGKPVRLSNYRGRSTIILVFNRGFF